MKPGATVLGVILALGLIGVPMPSDAQQPGKVYRIGYLGGSTSGYDLDAKNWHIEGSPNWQAFVAGLREYGYIPGQNLVIECRCTQARPLWGASATVPPHRPAGRKRLQASAAYPGEVEHPSRRAGACAVKGIFAEPMAARAEVGCRSLQP